MEIVCLGQQNWDYCWTGKQQLMTRLALRGHRVLYVDPQPDDARAERGRGADDASPRLPGLRRVGPGNLWVYTYPPAPAIGWRLNMRRMMRRAPVLFRELGFHAPLAVCLHPSMLPWLRRAECRAWLYFAVDEYTAYGEMPEEERQRTRELENTLAAEADVVLGVSERLHRRFAQLNPAAFLLESAADTEHFSPEKLARCAPHPALAELQGPVIGFIGQVDGRLDQPLLATLAERRPEWQFVLAGRIKGANVAPLAARPNIHLLGYQPYEVLPHIARKVDVWTVPYVLNELTHSCSPLKAYEYLATGRPVVATPLEGLSGCRGVIDLVAGDRAFEAAIERRLYDPDNGRDARLCFAAANSWPARVDRLEELLELAARRAKDAGGRTSPRLYPAAQAASRRTPRPYVNEHGEIKEPELGRGRRAAFRLARTAGALLYGARVLARAARGERPLLIRTILIVRQGYLGDFVALTPALRLLRRRYPHARIVLGVQHDMSATDLFRCSPDVDEVIGIDVLRASSRATKLRGFLQLLGRGFDLVVTGGEPFIMDEMHLTGAPWYVGLDDGYPKQALEGRLLGRDLAAHEGDNNLALIEAVTGASASDEDRKPALALHEPVIAEEGRALLAALDIDPARPMLLVHPGSKRASRRWPPERFTETITRLIERMPEVAVVLTGSPGERVLAAEIERRLPAEVCPSLRNAAGQTSLAGLIGLLDRASALLSNDTGIMHLARARGTPLLALLGPENHKVWGPHPLGDAPAVALRHVVPCAPCRVDRCAAHYCMQSLSVDEVEHQLEHLLAQGRSPGGAPVSLELHVRHHSWSTLKDAGFELPRVSVVVNPASASDLETAIGAALANVERQTYPEVEILLLRPRGAAGWTDPREAARRAALTVLDVPSQVGAEDIWSLAAEVAGGELLTAAAPGEDWSPLRLGLDVAAAMRSPEADFFRNGRPVLEFDAARGSGRRAALTRMFTAAPGRPVPTWRSLPGVHHQPRAPTRQGSAE